MSKSDDMPTSFYWKISDSKSIAMKGGAMRSAVCHFIANQPGVVKISVFAFGGSTYIKKTITVVARPFAAEMGYCYSRKNSTTAMVTWYGNQAFLSGVQLQYSRKKDMSSARYRNFKPSATYCTLHGLTKNKKYYVRARAYVKSKGKRYYGPWSKKAVRKLNYEA